MLIFHRAQREGWGTPTVSHDRTDQERFYVLHLNQTERAPGAPDPISKALSLTAQRRQAGKRLHLRH